MKRTRTHTPTRIKLALLLAIGVALVPQAAQAVSAGGGEWKYGADAKQVWSQYQHYGKWHKAWVQNLSQRVDTAAIQPGRQASISLRASLWGNQAGWGVF